MRIPLFLILTFLVSIQIEASPTPFQILTDQYFEDYFKQNPTAATAAGIHTYDSEMDDCTQKSITNEIKELKKYLSQYLKLKVKKLSEAEVMDRELILSQIQSRLLELEQIRSWQKNPDVYSSGINSAIYSIMSRNFASIEERLRSVITREKKALLQFTCAEANLKNPPRIYTEVALEQLPGIISFFEKDVVTAFKEAKDPQLLSEFKAANDALIAGFKGYEKFLKTKMLPLSKGDFRIGIKKFRKKLQYEEMVEIPLPELLKIGYENLRKNQAEFKAVAHRLDPEKSAAQVLEVMGKHHPKPEKVLETVSGMLGGLRQFIDEHKILTIPSPVPPIVQETPPFMRALTFASMDTPGPFETKAREAYYNLTLPEADWSSERVAEHMAGFSYETITATSIHEAYPGHYVQFLWVQTADLTKARKLIGANTNAEGWAHYCEQMILDEGYGKGDLKLRLGQLQDALLRNARFIVGVQMHTGQMSMEEGIEFFVKEGYQSHANAERETKRGTSDPTYLYYTLGKLEIQKLREDYRKMKGDSFRLQEFHDAFLKQGFPPLKLVRKALLGKEGPVL